MRHFALTIAIMMLAAPASAAPAVLRIELSSFAYSPRPIEMAAGRPVRLLLTNRSGAAHDFTARAFFAAAREVRGPVDDGEVELAGRASATVDLIPARGTYKVHCSRFGHKMLGMKAVIIVR